jgi:hypothetical protein
MVKGKVGEGKAGSRHHIADYRCNCDGLPGLCLGLWPKTVEEDIDITPRFTCRAGKELA